MYGWLNIGSLLLGLAAWVLPIVAISSKKSRPGLSALSFALCSISLTFAIFYNQYLVEIRDWSAIEDTHGAVTFAAAVLMAVTVVLNVIAAVKRHRK